MKILKKADEVMKQRNNSSLYIMEGGKIIQGNIILKKVKKLVKIIILLIT